MLTNHFSGCGSRENSPERKVDFSSAADIIISHASLFHPIKPGAILRTSAAHMENSLLSFVIYSIVRRPWDASRENLDKFRREASHILRCAENKRKWKFIFLWISLFRPPSKIGPGKVILEKATNLVRSRAPPPTGKFELKTFSVCRDLCDRESSMTALNVTGLVSATRKSTLHG